jgi:hypothetical protein
MLRRAALVIPFAGLVWAFHFLDPFRNLFFGGPRLELLAYSAGRLAFAAYFAVILFGLGRLVFIVFKKLDTACSGLDAFEEFLLMALVGSSLLRIGMLLLGLLGGYSVWTALVIAIVALLAATSRLAELFAIATKALARDGRHTAEGVARLMAAISIVLAVITTILFKVLFPNGTGDYFTHYFPYYMEVTEKGNILPNMIWYHFFISKGAGDIFFTILLGDALSPLSVSLVMYLLSLAMTWSFIRRTTNDALVALFGTAVLASGLIWTFETSIGFSHWAEFPKHHVIAAVCLFGSAWMVWRLIESAPADRVIWFWLNAIVVVSMIILRVQFAVLYILFLAILGGWLAWRTRRIERWLIGLATVASVGAVSILVVNYSITGLAEVTPFRPLWRLADQELFAQWVSPFLMLLLELGSSPTLGELRPPDLTIFPLGKLLLAVFRVDRLLPYLFGLFAASAIFLWIRSTGAAQRLTKPRKLKPGAIVLIAMLAAATLAALSVSQIGSLYRTYMFCIFPMVALGAMPFAQARMAMQNLGARERAIAAIAIGGLSLLAVFFWSAKAPRVEWQHRLRFSIGSATIADAYAAQNAMWAPGIEIRKLLGSQVRIWSSQITGQFCMAPDCNLETFFSYSLGREWAAIMFEPADIARAALERQGLNYFAIDTNAAFFDLLPYSPLFSANNIRNNLAVAWESDGVYLLTWPSVSTTPLDAAFDARYAHSKELALMNADFPAIYDQLNAVYQQWKKTRGWPVHLDPTKPHPRGWQ